MRTQKIFARLLVPVLAALLLLPPLSCLIFYQTAMRYAYHEAEQELQAFQEQLTPVIAYSFSQAAGGDPVRAFLDKAGPMASQLGGKARLLVLAGEMQVIYPRDDELRMAVMPLAEEFADYLQDGGQTSNGAVVFEAGDGEDYLVNIYEPPMRSERLRYIITYCPASEIGSWVKEAAALVLVIASVFVAVVFVILWAAVQSITRPLHRLCREAERIGGGSFIEIEPAFSLQELEELRVAMNRMSDQLMRADQSQKNFFQNVSHELRNPLMSISGYAQGIEQGVFQPPNAAAHTILTESQRLTALVNSLLTLSRLESGQQPAVLGTVRAAEVAADCLDRANGLAVQRGVTLRLSVSDQPILAYGEGIEAKDLPHLFERCYKGKDGNFGIGLAIAHSAAEKMGGHLEAANQPTGGAVFTLTLQRR